MEAEQLARKDSKWERIIRYYKEACQSTLLLGVKEDPKMAMEYYKDTYGNNDEGSEDVETLI